MRPVQTNAPPPLSRRRPRPCGGYARSHAHACWHVRRHTDSRKPATTATTLQKCSHRVSKNHAQMNTHARRCDACISQPPASREPVSAMLCCACCVERTRRMCCGMLLMCSRVCRSWYYRPRATAAAVLRRRRRARRERERDARRHKALLCNVFFVSALALFHPALCCTIHIGHKEGRSS